MTKKLSYTRLSKSRFLGLQHLSAGIKTPVELGHVMWGNHRMALVNAMAVVRELLLMELIAAAPGGLVGKYPLYGPTPKARPILANPSWICRYCSLDTSDSNKRLWAFPCLGCEEHHYVCRFCKKHALKVTGEFPYAIKVRGCPGTVEVPKRPEKKPRSASGKPKTAPPARAPMLVQEDLYEKKIP